MLETISHVGSTSQNCQTKLKMEDKNKTSNHTHSHNHSHSHEDSGLANNTLSYIFVVISFILLATGIVFEYVYANTFFNGGLELGWYIVAFLLVAFPVLKGAVKSLQEYDFFNEFTLMSIASIGAFFIKEYAEGVAVMLFYFIGELLQDAAVNRAQNNIKSLMDMQVNYASVWRNNEFVEVSPESVEVDEIIQIKPGERIPMDGILESPSFATLNTVALTGESLPRVVNEGGEVLGGMVNIDKVLSVKVTKEYKNSSLSRLLKMVQEAKEKKSKTELLVHRLAKVYTPAVFGLAILLIFIPALFVDHYIFSEWFRRALIFLVLSCPCALVISIPLGYFGGIGAASKAGILFKGANYLDTMAKVNTVVMDKTGTITKGVFTIQEIHAENAYTKQDVLDYIVALEQLSTHPIAKTITEFVPEPKELNVENVKEIAGHGLIGYINNQIVLVGNSKLMQKYDVECPLKLDSIIDTIVILAIDRKYAGYITISDEVKENVAEFIKSMKESDIKHIMLLSGDKASITQHIGNKVGIDKAYGDLLPEDKLKHIEGLKNDKDKIVAFMGDGINDAPSLALSDVGIAMGAGGSDAAIEVADVIIQTDQPHKVITAVKIANATKNIVYQNIALAIGIKLIVLILGGFGLATLWEAVFADVGVAMLAILNAVRILKRDFD